MLFAKNMGIADWQEQFLAVQARSHLAILHGNVYDEVEFMGARFETLERWLENVGSDCEFILRYNLGTGLCFIKGEEGMVVEALGLKKKKAQIDEDLLADIGATPPQQEEQRLPINPGELFPMLTQLFSKEQKVFFIMEYADSLLANEAGNRRLGEEALKVICKTWARDEGIGSRGHFICLISKRMADIDVSLRDTDLGIESVRVPKPNTQAREQFLRGLGIKKDLCGQLANLTTGFSRRMIRKVIGSNGSSDLVQHLISARGPMLEQDYGHIFKFIEPEFGFETIFGIDHNTDKLKQAVQWMREGRRNLVPQGILMAGPPRTGKTISAMALAKETGALFVELKNLRSKWVGSSESLQEDLEKACEELAPLIIVVDEADGRFGQRTGYRGDGGVSEGELSTILRVTSDTKNQGRVVWIFLCNKPWLLDKAFLQPGRADWRMAFLAPTKAEELAGIFKVMQLQCNCRADDKVDWKSLAEKVFGYNGGDLRAITKMAFEYACADSRERISYLDYEKAIDNYLPPEQDEDHVRMTMAAIKTASSLEFLPKEIRARMKKRRDEIQASRKKNMKGIELMDADEAEEAKVLLIPPSKMN